MGNRKNRERAESGQLFRDGKLVDKSEVVRPVSESERLDMHNRGEKKLRSMGTNKQIHMLAESLRTGRISRDYLRSALEKGAREEMAKGARRLRRKNREVTVEALLHEYRESKNWELRELSDKVGLGEDWYIRLAEAECS